MRPWASRATASPWVPRMIGALDIFTPKPLSSLDAVIDARDNVLSRAAPRIARGVRREFL